MVQVVPGVVVQLMFVTLQGLLELKGPAGIKIRFEFALLCTAPPIATIATNAEKRIFFIFCLYFRFCLLFSTGFWHSLIQMAIEYFVGGAITLFFVFTEFGL
jgi:hypothetical protein